MIKTIAKTIAKDFVENKIEKNKDTNIYANLTNHTISIFDIIANFSKYLILILFLIFTINISIPVMFYIITNSIFVSMIGFVLSIITTFVVLIKLINKTKQEVIIEISKTLKLATIR
jgi:hypothetical protein